jgi:hypothetical protein
VIKQKISELFENYFLKALDESLRYRTYWMLMIVTALLFNVLIILVANIFGNSKAGITGCVFIWAVFTGAVGLFMLSNKVVTALAGGFIGAGTSNLQSGSGLFSSLSNTISDISSSICKEFSSSCENDIKFNK